MLEVRHYPELATPELWAWLQPHVGDYANSDGRRSKWLVESEALPLPLAAVARAVCPDVPPGRWTRVALQCYEDGRAQTPCHTDAGATGFGFVLSLGATRTLRLHRVPAGTAATAGCGDQDLDVVKVECVPGTVVLMDEAFHASWHHWIAPEPGVTGERLSLVFRTQPGQRGESDR